MTSEPEFCGLDPKDWTAFRTAAHDLLDACIDQIAKAESHPWQPVPEAIREAYRLPDAAGGVEIAELVARLKAEVLPYGTGNTHPRFFGWVHGTGLAEGLVSEMVAATLNSNCGGRDHGMVYMERAVIDWARRQMGFPKTASGILVAGTSQSMVLALAAARQRMLGSDFRARGLQGERLTVYAGEEAHNSLHKAMELLGLGRNNLRVVPTTSGGFDPDQLSTLIADDRAAGALPLAIVGTAGSVDFGRFDDLRGLATLARQEDLWFHVDGAFGAWVRLADQPWRNLGAGIELADSLSCDFHKWMYIPYDCGLCLIREEKWHRAAFASRPSYLEGLETGLAGGDPWFCDYGIDLSRGNRALKVWVALQSHGTAALGQAITANCRAAAQMGTWIAAHPTMKLASPVVANLCVFTADSRRNAAAQSALNISIAQKLQLDGTAVFSTVKSRGVTCLRAAITNHRTRPADIQIAMEAVAREASILV